MRHPEWNWIGWYIGKRGNYCYTCARSSLSGPKKACIIGSKCLFLACIVCPAATADSFLLLSALLMRFPASSEKLHLNWYAHISSTGELSNLSRTVNEILGVFLFSGLHEISIWQKYLCMQLLSFEYKHGNYNYYSRARRP